MTYHLWVPLQKLSIEMVRLERNSAGGYTIAIVVMQMFTHVQISKIILYHHIPLTVSAQKKYSS